MGNYGNNHFSEQANFYARYRPVYPRELYEFIFSHLEQKKNAWDCGTGSGQVAGILADDFEEVYANDISTEQLNRAVRKSNILYVNKPAENTGFPSGFFDLVTVAQAIHWFNFDRFYREVKRTTRKKGIIALFGYGRVQINDEIKPVIDELYDLAFGTYFTKSRVYVDDKYRTIPFPFEEIPSPSFTFKCHWSLDELQGYFSSWSAIQKFKSEKGYNPAEKTIGQISDMLPANHTFEASFPVFLRLGRVHPGD